MAYFRCGGGLPTQTKSVTATTSQQIVVPDDGNLLESVTVNPQSHSSYYPSASGYYNVSGSEQINLGANHNYRYVRIKANSPTIVASVDVWTNPSPTSSVSNLFDFGGSFTRPSGTTGCYAYICLSYKQTVGSSGYSTYVIPWTWFSNNPNCGIGIGSYHTEGGGVNRTVRLIYCSYLNTSMSMPSSEGGLGKINLTATNCYQLGSSSTYNTHGIPYRIRIIWVKDEIHI